jgi:hypothetical protein
MLALVVYLGATVPDLELSQQQVSFIRRLDLEVDLDLILK